VSPVVGVTGANGYVGGRILAGLRDDGVEAVALVRRPEAGDGLARRYALAEPLDPSALEGIDTVVHAAYDASQRGDRIRAVNVDGSLPLLDGVVARGGRVVLISSLAAFDGARSLYGQAKLSLERAVLERGGVAVRPGLVFGAEAGGLFGAIASQVSTNALLPLPGGGSQPQFLAHDAHLAGLTAAIVGGRFAPSGPVFAAHETPSTLREIAATVASVHGARVRVLPVPQTPVYLAMRVAESTGLSLPFRSDSLLSLMNPIPHDQVAALERAPVAFPSLSRVLGAN
jgi:nucleoside-diphosphate-sugar epimerase